MTRRDRCMADSSHNVGDLDPMCQTCTESKCVWCMEDDERVEYFDNMAVFYQQHNEDPMLDSNAEDEYAAALIRITKEDADSRQDFNDDDIYLCSDCKITISVNQKLENALKTIENQKLTIETQKTQIEEQKTQIKRFTECLRLWIDQATEEESLYSRSLLLSQSQSLLLSTADI